jgi:glycosyltransferase involved in cell wall biosynthesis
LLPAATQKLVRARLPGIMPDYARLNERVPNAVWVINFVDGLLELNGISASTIILETHDISFLKFSKRYGYSMNSLKIKGKWRSEFALLEFASAIIAISAPEAALFRMFLPEKPIFFVPEYNAARFPNNIRLGQINYDLIFVGSDNMFNIDGLCAFITEYRDVLSKHKLAVAGNVCRSERLITISQNLPNVRLLGYIDDLAQLYTTCKVAISPVDGAGLKIKAVEALAAGKPVFGSRHTMEGLPLGYQRCVFPLDAIRNSDLLTDKTALAVAGEAARSYAKDLAKAFDVDRLKLYL